LKNQIKQEEKTSKQLTVTLPERNEMKKQDLSKLMTDFFKPSTPGGVIMSVGFGGPMFEQPTLGDWVEAINTLKKDKEFENIAIANAIPAEKGPDKVFFIRDLRDDKNNEEHEINVELIQRFSQYAIHFNNILMVDVVRIIIENRPGVTDEQIVEECKLLGVDVVVSNYLSYKGEPHKCVYADMGHYFIA